MAMRSLPECLDALLELIMLVCASYFGLGACLKNHRLSQEFRSLLPFSHHRRQTVLVANDQSEINNRKSKCFWRRGWDSNPRNGFPLTAFPVLPIQPLLHLSSIANFRLPIANWSLRGIDLLWQKTNRQSAIKNRQCHGGEGGIRTHGGR